MSCDICGAKDRTSTFYHGGIRPKFTYRSQRCQMCDSCQRAVAELVDQDMIHFRQELFRDTTNSRFSILKAAIKRRRYGDANVTKERMRSHDQQEDH